VEPEWRRELSNRLHAYRVRRQVAWALTYSPPCPLRLNPALGSKEQILCLPMPTRTWSAVASSRRPRTERVEFPSPDMKWHTRLRKSIVRLGTTAFGAAPDSLFPVRR